MNYRDLKELVDVMRRAGAADKEILELLKCLTAGK